MDAVLIFSVLLGGSVWVARRLYKAQQVAKAECKALDDTLGERNQELVRLANEYRQLQQRFEQLAESHRAELKSASIERAALDARVQALSRYQGIVDADSMAKTIVAEASEILSKAEADARQAVAEATREARARVEKAEQRLAVAGEEADKIISLAKVRAEEIAGDAYVAMTRAKDYETAAKAMKNIINGYGDQYIIPSYHLLDGLAEDFGHVEAGQRLKAARETTRSMVKNGLAAACDYVEPARRDVAVRFVVDAFNGKVDSILSRSKADNYGKLEQEIRDAFALVNHNGAAFRNARITDGYLNARFDELKWAATTGLLRDQERDEQRRLREQIREEEKARREFERAIKDAAKEEEMLRKALAKAEQQIARASEEQRAEFEAKLLELQEKLQTAEDKNQRALSMAQQTRSGHVYVISNLGSFGEKVFKIGMTRRLDPSDRIRELGDASVPFAFDVHAMIFSEDAPGLEKRLHRHFLRQQVNKVNPRKEFFRVGLESIRSELDALGIQAHWTMAAEAHEYRESLRIEQQIEDDPGIAAEWARHQMDYEVDEDTEVEEVA